MICPGEGEEEEEEEEEDENQFYTTVELRSRIEKVTELLMVKHLLR